MGIAKYTILIDNRETKLINLFEKTQLDNFDIKICKLEIGDIHIVKNVNNDKQFCANTSADSKSENTKIQKEHFIQNDKNSTLLIIERKTCQDLLASINDNRYREQKARLLANYNLNQVCYLIENNIDDKLDRYRKNGKKIVLGAIINKLFRDQIKIIRTYDVNESYIYLL